MSRRRKRGRNKRHTDGTTPEGSSLVPNGAGSSIARNISPPTGQETRRLRWIFGTLCTGALLCLSLAANLWQVASLLPMPPEIHVQPAQVDDPFSIHFSAKNPSSLFVHQHVTFLCAVRDVKAAAHFTDLYISDRRARPVDVAPGEMAHFSCVLNKIFSVESVVSARIDAIISYSTFGYERQPAMQQFTWDARSRQWIEGHLVN